MKPCSRLEIPFTFIVPKIRWEASNRIDAERRLGDKEKRNHQKTEEPSLEIVQESKWSRKGLAETDLATSQISAQWHMQSRKTAQKEKSDNRQEKRSHLCSLNSCLTNGSQELYVNKYLRITNVRHSVMEVEAHHSHTWRGRCGPVPQKPSSR